MYAGDGEEEEDRTTQYRRDRAARGGRTKSYTRCVSLPNDDLQSFRSWLQWMCVDQSSFWRAALSWIVFLTLSVAVPLVSHFVLLTDSDKEAHSLSSVAALSFICLSTFFRRYGLRRFLSLDKLCRESEAVSSGYTAQLNRSFKLLSMFVAPCFVIETGYKVWWYIAGARRIPFLGNPYVSDVVACAFELCSWLYRTAIFFLVCLLFRLICFLQILRLQDFALVFEDSDVAFILAEHLRIRRQLRVISHRFRFFIVSCLVLITLSQLASLLHTTRSDVVVDLLNAGELTICSLVLVAGILLCLRSAAKITHKAQAITSHAAKWHAFATIDSCDEGSNAFILWTISMSRRTTKSSVTTMTLKTPRSSSPCKHHVLSEEAGAGFMLGAVTYLENNRAGITVFGFMVDRAWLHMIFGVELSLVLWLLGKTVGISRSMTSLICH
ncbi:unnamed protein product [Spirodela intermedia]|uniref:Uncharacterized protein n=1 Tax=Spirodela intermedia TaxID=51605 RepID=A0A7I8JIM7_SPIIN|nr:unnamed protein product [Spirodela intermedia]CAA6670014.1 unnamed protein product [Spirodela intermedia]